MFKFNVSPKYKKSFVEYTVMKKEIDNKIVKITRELVWRSGEIEINISKENFEKYCKDKNLQFSELNNNEYKLFESMKKSDVLTIDDSFPFEYEFLSSFDGCSDDYNVCYDDGSDVEDSIQEEIDNILEEGDFYDLEDDHGYNIDDTKYEMHGELEIQIIN